MKTLDGKLIALSISDAPDRLRLGFPAREVDRALFTLCTVLVRAGAKIVYGGNLEQNGFTFSMFRHLKGAYAASQDTPFLHIVPEPVLRDSSLDSFSRMLKESAAVVETLIQIETKLMPVRYIENGVRIGKGSSAVRLTESDEFQSWLGGYTLTDVAQAFSLSRKSTTDISDARIVLGGKMGVLSIASDKYLGSMPGIVEEAILALETNKPCVPLGAFGGAARDVAIALNLLEDSKRVPRGKQLSTYWQSIEKVSQLRAKIPNEIRPALSVLADDDRGEALAYEAANALRLWFNKT